MFCLNVRKTVIIPVLWKKSYRILDWPATEIQAKADFLKSYEEIKEMLAEEGKEVPVLEFSYKYDLQSFFNYFSFLNISKIAEVAGINPSLMRQYASGVANVGEKQYDKIRIAIKKIGNELVSAQF